MVVGGYYKGFVKTPAYPVPIVVDGEGGNYCGFMKIDNATMVERKHIIGDSSIRMGLYALVALW